MRCVFTRAEGSITGEALYIIRNLLRYIIKAERFVSHQAAREYAFGDDIRLTAMIYTLKRDDIPSLRLG